MKKNLQITAVLDQPGLLENLVERLASRRYDIGYSREMVTKDWKPVEVSSTETYVSGTLSFSSGANAHRTGSMKIPFITSLLFTCIKEDNEDYRLLWSSSLS